MTEIDNETRIYELAYHLSPDLEEANIRTLSQDLNNLIAKSGASVLKTVDPQKVHLSYEVKNKNYAYFGVFDFTAPAEAIEKINTDLKLQNGVFRYLLLKKPAEGKDLRVFGEYRSRPRITKTHETVAAPPKTTKPKTEAEETQLEQEVEKVIEGL